MRRSVHLCIDSNKDYDVVPQQKHKDLIIFCFKASIYCELQLGEMDLQNKLAFVWLKSPAEVAVSDRWLVYLVLKKPYKTTLMFD